MQNESRAVSYTHLDVYKRQIIIICINLQITMHYQKYYADFSHFLLLTSKILE